MNLFITTGEEKKFILRTIALGVITTFLCQEAALAAQIAPQNPTLLHSQQSKKWANQVLPNLPESVALIDDAYRASDSTKAIILIQDAHTNEIGQLNVARFLEQAFTKTSARHIFLEAGSGDVSLSFLRKYASEEKRKQVAKSLVMRGRLQGSEYFDLTSSHDAVLWGVEDQSLYNQSLASYKEAIQAREKFHNYLNQMESTIQSLKPHIYNPSLIAFDQKYEQHHAQELSLAEYFKVLRQEAKRLHIDVSKFSRRFSQALSNGKNVSAKEAQAFLEEQKSLEEALYQAHFANTKEEYLWKTSRKVGLLKKLLHLTLTPEEFEAYNKEKQNFTVAHLTGFLNQTILDLQSQYERVLFLEEGFEEAIAQCESFYELTYARDQKFVENVMSKMNQDQADQAILITGGYHTPNLKSLLKTQGISYIVVTPKILHETNQKRYEQILLSQRIAPSFTMNTLPVATNMPRQLIMDAAAARLSSDPVPSHVQTLITGIAGHNQNEEALQEFASVLGARNNLDTLGSRLTELEKVESIEKWNLVDTARFIRVAQRIYQKEQFLRIVGHQQVLEFVFDPATQTLSQWNRYQHIDLIWSLEWRNIQNYKFSKEEEDYASSLQALAFDRSLELDPKSIAALMQKPREGSRLSILHYLTQKTIWNWVDVAQFIAVADRIELTQDHQKASVYAKTSRGTYHLLLDQEHAEGPIKKIFDGVTLGWILTRTDKSGTERQVSRHAGTFQDHHDGLPQSAWAFLLEKEKELRQNSRNEADNQASRLASNKNLDQALTSASSAASRMAQNRKIKAAFKFIDLMKRARQNAVESDKWSKEEAANIMENVFDWLMADDAIVSRKHKAAIYDLIKAEDVNKIKNGFLNKEGIIWPGTAGFRGPMENLSEGKVGPNYIGDVLMYQYADIYRSYLSDQLKRHPLEKDQVPYAYGFGEVRLNTERYGKILSRGIAAAGVQVIHHFSPKERPFSTPLASHAAQYFTKVYGSAPLVGFTVSGSHNGLKDNGVKLFNRFGGQLLPEEVELIKPFKNKLRDIKPLPSAQALREQGLLVELETIFEEGETNKESNLYQTLLEDYFDSTLNSLEPAFIGIIQEAANNGMRFVFTPLNGATYQETNRFLTERVGLREGKHYLIPESETTLPQNDLSHEAWQYKDFDPARKGILDKTIRFAEANDIPLVFARDLDGDRIVLAIKTSEGWKYLDGNQNAILMLQDKLEALTTEAQSEAIKDRFVMMRTHVTTPLLDQIARFYEVSEKNIGVVPVGFKFFGSVIIRKLGKWGRFYFGAEESYGYSNGVDPEKDSLTGLANLLLIAAKEYNNGKRNPYDRLLEVYKHFGYTGDITTKVEIPGAGPAEQQANKAKTLTALSQLQEGSLISDRYVVKKTDHEFLAPIFSSNKLRDGFRFILEDTQSQQQIQMIIRASGTEPVFKHYFFWTNPQLPTHQQSAQDVVDQTLTYVNQTFSPTIHSYFQETWRAASRLTKNSEPNESGATLNKASFEALLDAPLQLPGNQKSLRSYVSEDNYTTTSLSHPWKFAIHSEALDFHPEELNVSLTYNGKQITTGLGDAEDWDYSPNFYAIDSHARDEEFASAMQAFAKLFIQKFTHQYTWDGIVHKSGDPITGNWTVIFTAKPTTSSSPSNTPGARLLSTTELIENLQQSVDASRLGDESDSIGNQQVKEMFELKYENEKNEALGGNADGFWQVVPVGQDEDVQNELKRIVKKAGLNHINEEVLKRAEIIIFSAENAWLIPGIIFKFSPISPNDAWHYRILHILEDQTIDRYDDLIFLLGAKRKQKINFSIEDVTFLPSQTDISDYSASTTAFTITSIQNPDSTDQKKIWEEDTQKLVTESGIERAEDVNPLAYRVIDEWKIKNKAKILSLGSGVGYDEIYFAKQGYQVVATDFVEQALHETQQIARAEGVELQTKIQNLNEPLQFENEEFDVVYAHLALHYFDDQALDKLVNEIKRVLKPDGKVILAVRSTEDWKYQEALAGKGKSRVEGDFLIDPRGKVQRFFDEAKLRDSFESFEQLDLRQNSNYLRFKGESPTIIWELIATKSLASDKSGARLANKDKRFWTHVGRVLSPGFEGRLALMRDVSDVRVFSISREGNVVVQEEEGTGARFVHDLSSQTMEASKQEHVQGSRLSADLLMEMHEWNEQAALMETQAATAKVVLIDSFEDLEGHAFYKNLIRHFGPYLSEEGRVIFVSSDLKKAEEIAALAQSPETDITSGDQFVAMTGEELQTLKLPTSYILAEGYLSTARSLYGENRNYFSLKAPTHKNHFGMFALAPVGRLMDLVSLKDWDEAAHLYGRILGKQVTIEDLQSDLSQTLLIPFVSELASRLAAQAYLTERTLSTSA